jgi:hypothetical protein
MLLLALPTFWMLGCSTSSRVRSTLENKYRYYVSLSAPQKSADLLFRDDRLIIQFRFDDPAIRFQAQNLTRSSMQFDWPHASLALGGSPYSVRNVANYYDTSSVPGVSPEIPSLGVVRDVIAPRPGISLRGREWRSADLLPTTDGNSFERESAIRGMVGKAIELTLPVKFDAERATYQFVFVIDSVKQISWSDHRTPDWLPTAPPVRSLGPTAEDRITAAVIVGGFAGFLRYMMTMKKTPVVE